VALTRPEPRLRVEVLNAAGTRVGALFGATKITRTRKLDGVGSVVIELPAQDPAAALCTPGRSYKATHITAGDLGQWLHLDDEVQVRGDAAVVRVSGLATASVLSRRSARFNRRYENITALEILNDLRAAAAATDTYPNIAPAWVFAPHDPGGALQQRITIDIEGQSLMSAIEAIRRATRTHWRETTPYRIEIGTFSVGTLNLYGGGLYGSEVYLGTLNTTGAIQAINLERGASAVDSATAAIISSIDVLRHSSAVANRIIAVGAGEGLNQLTLQASYDAGSRTSPYTIRRMLNADGSYTYFIEDRASIDTYGVTEIVLARSDVRPITNSATGIRLASDSLYDIAAALLAKSASPTTEYRIKLATLPAAANVGGIIRLRYRGLAAFADDSGSTLTKWIDVDQYCTITEITEAFGDGATDISITVSTTGERVTTDADIIVALQQELNAQKVRVQPYPCRDTIAESGMIQAATATQPAFSWEMQIPIENEVLYLLKAVLTVKLFPLRSTIDNSSTVALYFTGGGTILLSGVSTPSTGINRYPYQTGFDNGHTNPPETVLPANSGDPFYTSWGHFHQTYAPDHIHEVPRIAGQIFLGYGIYDDPGTVTVPNTPTDLSVALNGAAMIGPVNPGNNNVQTYDITAALLAAPTLRQIHRLTFACASGRGIVQASVRLFLGVQATLSTI
jgi:hypothetical protein